MQINKLLQYYEDAKLFFTTATWTGNDKLFNSSALDSTLKCILQHTLWGFYWFIMSMFNFLTLVQCDKWRALGSEILFINSSLQWILSTPILPGCLKRTTLLSKKVIPCNKRVHPSQMRFLCWDYEEAEYKRSQQDGYLSSEATLSNQIITGFQEKSIVWVASCNKSVYCPLHYSASPFSDF